MTIFNELLDELLQGCKRPEDLLCDAGLMKELKIRLMERIEPRRVCRRLQLLSRMEHHEQDDEQVFP